METVWIHSQARKLGLKIKMSSEIDKRVQEQIHQSEDYEHANEEMR